MASVLSRLRLAALLPAACTLPAASACTRVELIQPAQGQAVGQRTPILRWGGEPGASFRVEVQVVVPESRVVASIDLQVQGLAFTLPQVPASRALVRARVSTGCTSSGIQSDPPWFFIDARPRCVVDAVSTYTVRSFARPQPRAASGALPALVASTTTQNVGTVDLAVAADAALAVVLVPVCDGNSGEPIGALTPPP